MYFLLIEILGKDVLLICRLQRLDDIIYRQPPVCVCVCVGGGGGGKETPM